MKRSQLVETSTTFKHGTSDGEFSDHFVLGVSIPYVTTFFGSGV